MNAKPLNIAHRGARSLAPENTIAAARAALEAGAGMWELDVTITADGELVLLHDDTLEQTSNAAEVYPDRAPWMAQDFTLEELRALDFGSWFNRSDPFGQIAAGAVTEAMQRSYAGEPIPTLREALIFTRDNEWQVNVEIKDALGGPGEAALPESVAALIEELDMVDRVLVSSFNHDYLRRVKAACPGIATAALVERAPADPAALVKGLGAAAYHPGLGSIRPADIPALRAAGVDVNVWTVNDAQDMRELIQYQASGIITDFPQLLAQILNE